LCGSSTSGFTGWPLKAYIFTGPIYYQTLKDMVRISLFYVIEIDISTLIHGCFRKQLKNNFNKDVNFES